MGYLKQCIPMFLLSPLLLSLLPLLALAVFPLLLLAGLCLAVTFFVSANPATFGALLLLLLSLEPCARRASVDFRLVLNHVFSFLSLHLHLPQLALLSFILNHWVVSSKQAKN